MSNEPCITVKLSLSSLSEELNATTSPLAWTEEPVIIPSVIIEPNEPVELAEPLIVFTFILAMCAPSSVMFTSPPSTSIFKSVVTSKVNTRPEPIVKSFPSPSIFSSSEPNTTPTPLGKM